MDLRKDSSDGCFVGSFEHRSGILRDGVIGGLHQLAALFHFAVARRDSMRALTLLPRIEALIDVSDFVQRHGMFVHVHVQVFSVRSVFQRAAGRLVSYVELLQSLGEPVRVYAASVGPAHGVGPAVRLAPEAVQDVL